MTRAMKDSGIEWIGEIPEDWKIHRNKVVFSCNKEIVGENSNNIQLLSLTTGGVKTKDINSVGGKLPESFDTYQYVAIDNIVMCLFDLDMSAVFSGISNYNGMISPAYKVLKCNNNYIIPKYADYWFKFVFVDRKFATYAKNLRYTLSYDEFGVLSIPIPSLPEQQKIADFLDEKCSHIDSILEKTKASIDECKQLKQSVITQAVTKGIRPNRPMKDSGIEWIGQIPEDWKISKVKREFSYGSGLPITKENLIENGVPVISYGQIHAKFNTGVELDEKLYRYVSEDYLETNSNSLVNKYDFIFADTSEDLEGCGNCAYISEQMTLFAGYHTIVLHSKKAQDNRYIAYLFKSPMWRNQITSRVTGIKVFSISKKILNACTLLIPSFAEQIEIANYLDLKCSEIDKLIAKKEQLIEELETYKKSLIYEYVTGKKEVI